MPTKNAQPVTTFTNEPEIVNLAERQANFEQAVAYSLHLWPALTLAVQNGWGGPDSADKRDWFAGAIVDLFPEFTDVPSAKTDEDEPDTEYVETVLLQVMFDEFDVNTDDDSGFEVAETIIRARAQCAIGQFDEFNKLAERFKNLRGQSRLNVQQGEDVNQDTDWDSDDDEDEGDDGDDDRDDGHDKKAVNDAAMPDAPVAKEKPAPEIDEDGFTKVTYKKR